MADTEYAIVHEKSPAGGRYVIDLAPGLEAEMTYRQAADGPMVIDHTGVPPQFEGRGIALQLVKAAIADAREKGFKIKPVCPYVVVQFRRHPDWADLLAQA
ncbi:GNAT family N-acetyltransferase [Devosia chinhatensis]|uniref:Acetyltransferase n=1 Tax=Devosia chinhatensis TaxID=429727 RepID=A0A0F5FH91_9HYPH|nr:GNAT family N-acetyltransferase [Devosia chinhatensis]KKB07552.1 acetyltransferase [Devosia chinhatensis]